MSRIRELKITDQLFDRELPKDFSIIPAYKEEYNTPIFVLHFSEKIAYKVYDEFQEKYIKKLDDGTLEVTFRYQLYFLFLRQFQVFCKSKNGQKIYEWLQLGRTVLDGSALVCIIQSFYPLSNEGFYLL